MKIIFLDIDGVLNCQNTFIERHKKKMITGYYDLEIDINMVKYLSQIVEKTNALVVLSSSWRIFFCNENGLLKAFDKGLQLVNLLNKYNIAIYDITPYDTNRNRGLEIVNWLNCHDVSNFIIIDDEKCDLMNLKDNLILCDFYGDGLNYQLSLEAINKLNSKKCSKIKRF